MYVRENACLFPLDNCIYFTIIQAHYLKIMTERVTTLSEDLYTLVNQESQSGGKKQMSILAERARLEKIELRKEGSSPNSPGDPIELSLVPEGDPQRTTVVRLHPTAGLISAAVCGTNNPNKIRRPALLGMLWGLSETSDVVVNEYRFADLDGKRVALNMAVNYCADGRDKGLFAGSSLRVGQTDADGRYEETIDLKLYNSLILRDLLAGRIKRFDCLANIKNMGRVEFAMTKTPPSPGKHGASTTSVLLTVSAHAERERPSTMRFGHLPVRVTAKSLMETFRARLIDLVLTGGTIEPIS